MSVSFYDQIFPRVRLYWVTWTCFFFLRLSVATSNGWLFHYFYAVTVLLSWFAKCLAEVFLFLRYYIQWDEERRRMSSRNSKFFYFASVNEYKMSFHKSRTEQYLSPNRQKQTKKFKPPYSQGVAFGVVWGMWRVRDVTGETGALELK